MNATKLQKLGIDCRTDIPVDAVYYPEAAGQYGVTEEGIEKLKILGEVINEFLTEKIPQGERVDNSIKAAEILSPLFKGKTNEELWILCLDNKLNLKKAVLISKGVINYTLIDKRKIILEMLNCKASSMIMAHNHPSGKVEPSQNDLQETEKVRKVLKMFDMSLSDHIIIGNDKYYSFADEEVAELPPQE